MKRLFPFSTFICCQYLYLFRFIRKTVEKMKNTDINININAWVKVTFSQRIKRPGQIGLNKRKELINKIKYSISKGNV